MQTLQKVTNTKIPTFTDAGVQTLGALIRESRKAQGWSQPKFQQILAERFSLNRALSTIQGIERPAVGYHPDWEFVNAIAALGVVRDPTGQPYDTQHLMLIACEVIDPSEPLINQGEVVSMEGSEQIRQIIRDVVSRAGLSVDEVARQALFKKERLQGLIDGSVIPTFGDISRMASSILFIKTNGTRWELMELEAIARGEDPEKFYRAIAESVIERELGGNGHQDKENGVNGTT